MFKNTSSHDASKDKTAEAVRPLTTEEIDLVSGGKMLTTSFTVGNDMWVIAASAKGYAVSHIHVGN